MDVMGSLQPKVHDRMMPLHANFSGQCWCSTEIAMHQLLRETARHLQAQAIPRIIQNRVDLQGPLQQPRLFSDVRAYFLSSRCTAVNSMLVLWYHLQRVLVDDVDTNRRPCRGPATRSFAIRHWYDIVTRFIMPDAATIRRVNAVEIKSNRLDELNHTSLTADLVVHGVQEELESLAQTLHAEGTLLLETARAVSAYLLAQRSNSAGPLLNATAYYLRPDGSAPANTVPAALSNRRLTQDRRNAIFINGRPDGGAAAPGAGQVHFYKPILQW